MSGLSGESLQQYENLNALGHAANQERNYEAGLVHFNAMKLLAKEADDPLKIMHALNPAAKAHWSMGQFEEAESDLAEAEEWGTQCGLADEAAIARSNIGRVAACRIVAQRLPLREQARALKEESAPSFARAYDILRGHPHYYYRYANAQHGAVVSTLANERMLAARLIAEGLQVAPRRSPYPYDEAYTFTINKAGLAQLASAMVLLPLGYRTPALAQLARRTLVR